MGNFIKFRHRFVFSQRLSLSLSRFDVFWRWCVCYFWWRLVKASGDRVGVVVVVVVVNYSHSPLHQMIRLFRIAYVCMYEVQ